MENILNVTKNFKVCGIPTAAEQCFIGHINDTYFVDCKSNGCILKYVIQRINDSIFKKPWEIMENIVGVTNFLREKIAASGGDVKRETLTVIKTLSNTDYYVDERGNYWRCYDFITNATSYQSVERHVLFYNSALAFGNFQRQLADYPAANLHEAIPNFHNTVSRHADFRSSVKNNIAGRLGTAKPETDFILKREDVCGFIVNGIADGSLPLRVTHNDTKLNNIMIDNKTDLGVCVIDLDTVMPGSVLYDFGDSIRFGASSAAEDETDLDKVFIRLDLFEEFTRGFIKGLSGSLTETEVRSLPMGALIITLETGMRFLGDYLNGDIYFKIHRENHNLDRARTQLKLVSDMEDKMSQMNAIVEKYL